MQLEALQSLALSVAAARSPDEVLKQVVQGLGMTEGVALARVWLLRSEPGEEPFLELEASIGASIVQPDLRWNRTDGAHQKIPLSYGKVGFIASRNEALLLQRGTHDWLMQPDWAEAESIESFAGQPLTFRGEVLGVAAVFSRRRLEKHDLKWLRVFADHAAVAVANTRAYAQLERLEEQAKRERDYLRAAVRDALQHGEVIAESPAMREVLAQARAVALSSSSVLILGESGVGKELIAAAVHDMSPRRDGPLVKVNCASVPRELFESEFFGHVKGAFSGALRDRQGRFALADGGTLFLDEVGEIPLALQGKLLRVLQEGTFEPVGDDRTRRVNVRVIAATNRPLEAEVEASTFRRDLYYRLSVLPIHVPPLRERREDIVPMARRFLHGTAQRLNLPARPLSPEYERTLLAYDFPGNVRELQNIIERDLVLRRDDRLQPGRELGAVARGGSPAPSEPATSPSAREPGATGAAGDAPVLTLAELRELEHRNFVKAMEVSGYQIAGPRGAARLLGMSPSTLSYHLKRLGIERPRGPGGARPRRALARTRAARPRDLEGTSLRVFLGDDRGARRSGNGAARAGPRALARSSLKDLSTPMRGSRRAGARDSNSEKQMPAVTIPPHKSGDFLVDYEEKVFEDVKAQPGEKALVTFHTVAFEGSIGLVNLLQATRLLRKGFDTSVLLYGPGVTIGVQRGFPKLGDEAFPGHMAMNGQLVKFMKEGGKAYACRFALQALYGHGEASLIEGIRPINPLDVLDLILLHRRDNAFIINTWTM